MFKRVIKYMERRWIVPFPLTSFVTNASFDGALLRAFFIRPYVVNKNVEWWLLYQSNVPNVFQHFVRMKDELNYCIGSQITDLTELASVRITTAENMLIRGICESVEVSTTKLANGKPLLDTNLSGSSELCAQSVRYSKCDIRNRPATNTQLTKAVLESPFPIRHPSLNVTTECCCFI